MRPAIGALSVRKAVAAVAAAKESASLQVRTPPSRYRGHSRSGSEPVAAPVAASESGSGRALLLPLRMPRYRSCYRSATGFNALPVAAETVGGLRIRAVATGATASPHSTSPSS